MVMFQTSSEKSQDVLNEVHECLDEVCNFAIPQPRPKILGDFWRTF